MLVFLHKITALVPNYVLPNFLTSCERSKYLKSLPFFLNFDYRETNVLSWFVCDTRMAVQKDLSLNQKLKMQLKFNKMLIPRLE